MHFVDVIAEYVDITEIGDSDDILPGLEKCKKPALLDLCARISMALPRPREQKTPFSYVGNSAVSGFPYPCDAFNCRSQNFASAVGFAAIYADESIFFDPFIEIGGTMMSLRGKVPVGLVRELSFYIRQILMARPLIDRGICVFETAEHEHYCSNCFAHAVSLISKGTDLTEDPGIFVSLIQDYANSSSVSYDGKSGDFFVYRASASDELSDHDIYRYSPNKIGGSRIKKGQKLTPAQVIQLGIPQKFAHFASFDILGTNAALNAGTRNSITTTPYVNSLAGYFGKDTFRKNLSVDYPLISGGRLDDILRFRDQEWHHLDDFRSLVEEAVSSGKDATLEIQSSSNRIDRIISKNNRLLNKGILKDAVISSTGIAATVLTSGVSGLVAAAVGLLSAGHLAKDVVPKIIDRFTEPEALRDEKAYYVWKLRKSALS